jgi:deoxycitidine kinase
MLDEFYADKKSMAFAFQMYVLLTQRRAYSRAIASDKGIGDLVVIERGSWMGIDPMSDLMREKGYINDVEWALYEDWRSDVSLPFPHGLVYLRTEPEQCLSRIRVRNRPEETSKESIDIEYLRCIHDAHERMVDRLKQSSSPDICLLVLDGNKDPAEMAREIREWAKKIGCTRARFDHQK